MAELKCKKCFRGRDSCELKKFVELTLPWINDALNKTYENDSEKSSEMGRILRGNKNSPGFLTDWIHRHAITEADARKLIDELSKRNKEITLEFICNRCRYYSGPSCR